MYKDKNSIVLLITRDDLVVEEVKIQTDGGYACVTCGWWDLGRGCGVVPMDADNEEELDVTVIDDAPKVATLNWEVGFRRLLVENAEFRAGHYSLYKHELIEAAFVNREGLLSFKDCFGVQLCRDAQ
ncbi:hypothetical protein Tcan_15953 [Toxocara canis]|uniref:Uncharacterized protein n=1 Tax=Toxocara canis TaxID=6265 RepID=A0A0B2UZE8_TOXCA|nr:hypothetical protein Tcan_15953 [Toxocara canis]